MSRYKKAVIVNEVTATEPEVTKEIVEKCNLPIMMKDTKEIKCIKKSEYNHFIHICL